MQIYACNLLKLGLFKIYFTFFYNNRGMVYDESMTTIDEFNKSAEPSAVQYGPQVALNLDPADLTRTFINTMDLLQLLLAGNETPAPEHNAEYSLIG